MPFRCSRWPVVLLVLFAVTGASRPALSQDTLWSYSHPYGDVPFSYVYDFSGDGSPDVIFNISGAPFEIRDTATQALVFQSPANSTVWDVHDFDGDSIPDLLAAVDVNGTPLFLPLLFQPFNSDQVVLVDSVGTPALSGTTVTLAAFGIGLSGGVAATAPLTLTFL